MFRKKTIDQIYYMAGDCIKYNTTVFIFLYFLPNFDLEGQKSTNSIQIASVKVKKMSASDL